MTGSSFRLRALHRLDPLHDGRHVGVDHRRQVQRHQLREGQAADHRQAQRPARFAARAVAQRDRQRAQQRRHGGHHDRPEADQAAFVDRLARRLALLALGLQREIDLHDGVLLHDADQHDQAHERVDAQFDLEHQQRQQRAETGRGQARQNRERVHVALIQHAQHDVHHHDRHDQQDAHVLHRVLEHLGGALERTGDGGRQVLLRRRLDFVGGLAQRHARAQGERDGHRRQLARSAGCSAARRRSPVSRPR